MPADSGKCWGQRWLVAQCARPSPHAYSAEVGGEPARGWPETPTRLGTMVIGVGPGPQATSTPRHPQAAGLCAQAGCSGLSCGTPFGGLSQVKPRLSQGPGSIPVLVAANLGIPDGPPDIKDKFVWECEVTKPFIQSLCQFIWVPFVFSQLHHGGSQFCVSDPHVAL